MSRSRRRSRNKKKRGFPWGKLVFGTLGLFLVLGMLAYFLAVVWVKSYMRSQAMADKVEHKIGVMLKAEPEMAALEWTGQSVYCDSLAARGGQPSFFSDFTLEAIRAEIDLSGLSDRVVGLPVLQADRGRMLVGDERRGMVPEPLPKLTGLKARLAPKRVEVPEARIENFTFEFNRNGTRVVVAGTQAVFRPHYEPGNFAEGHIDIDGIGGTLEMPGSPKMDIDNIQLRVSQDGVFIKNAMLSHGDEGLVEGGGEILFGKRGRIDTQVRVRELDLDTLVADKWKGRVKGVANFDLDTDVRFSDKTMANEGVFAIAQAVVQDLPVLDKLAEHTRDDRFRQLDLSEAKGRFKRDGDRIEIRELELEKNNLIRIIGDADIMGGFINGKFEVGVVREALRYIPGAERKVFTRDEEGYVWTTFRLTGPLSAPREDLSARLKAGAVEAVVEDTANAAIDTAGAAAELGVGTVSGVSSGVLGALAGTEPGTQGETTGAGEGETKGEGEKTEITIPGIGILQGAQETAAEGATTIIGEGVGVAKDAAGGAAKILGDFVPLLP